MYGRHELERRGPNGYTVYAWLDKFEEEDVIKVQWRDPSGKPVHQPFHLYLNVAKEGFQMLAAFAEEMRTLHASGSASASTKPAPPGK